LFDDLKWDLAASHASLKEDARAWRELSQDIQGIIATSVADEKTVKVDIAAGLKRKWG
jgi:hypothetical protein